MDCPHTSFNSIKVRLIPTLEQIQKEDLAGFNSIKVRLIHGGGLCRCVVPLFQFHKGSINTTSSSSVAPDSLCFNSIKVRLIPHHYPTSEVAVLFQFHKGSINTRRVPFRFTVAKLFQFHKGSINTYILSICIYFIGGFNSIKVRLILKIGCGVYHIV